MIITSLVVASATQHSDSPEMKLTDIPSASTKSDGAASCYGQYTVREISVLHYIDIDILIFFCDYIFAYWEVLFTLGGCCTCAVPSLCINQTVAICLVNTQRLYGYRIVRDMVPRPTGPYIYTCGLFSNIYFSKKPDGSNGRTYFVRGVKILCP